MKRLITLLSVLIVLLATAGVVAADPAPLGDFSISGVPTNMVSEDFPFLGPEDFIFLGGGGYAKFHVTNAGQATGSLAGPFTMEEWGVVDLGTFTGANVGEVDIVNANPVGDAHVRFSGPFDAFGVSGAFSFAGGTGAFSDLKMQGYYRGDAALGPFTVDFSPCRGQSGPACGVSRCAVFGGNLEPQPSGAVWNVANLGNQSATIGTLFVDWPAINGRLLQIKLDNVTIFDQPTDARWALIGTSSGPTWVSTARNRKISGRETSELEFVFENTGGNSAPSDYSVLINFTNGCAASWAAF